MISARLRVTLVFVAGLASVAIAIIIALSMSRTAAIYSDTGQTALTNARLAMHIIDAAAEHRIPIVAADSSHRIVLVDPVRTELDAVPGYLLVIDRDSTLQFASVDAHALRDQDWLALQEGIAGLPADGPAGIITLAGRRVLLVATKVHESASGLDRIIAGVPVDSDVPWPGALVTTMFVIVPLLIALGAWGGWIMIGHVFKRLERVRREVTDIADGRSLHRRLSTDEAPPELASLIATLNAMIMRLESSFMALRRFTADASHELKTPLAVLRADVERAMGEASKSERLVALEEALHEVTRMTNLVESLLTLARADEGRFEIHREPVDLRDLVQEVYETASILGEAAGVTVTLAFTTDVTILADRTRLRQLFLNLVTNAIKYTPAGGRVDLGLGRHPDNVTFAVRDTGIGIAAADVPHIFERFWRADQVRTRTAERGGFGLGLAISQWIAHAHGGTLTVSSRLGKGSLFTVTLPLTGQ